MNIKKLKIGGLNKKTSCFLQPGFHSRYIRRHCIIERLLLYRLLLYPLDPLEGLLTLVEVAGEKDKKTATSPTALIYSIIIKINETQPVMQWIVLLKTEQG